MADNEKKERLSGESPRLSEPTSTLPTVNVTTEKQEPPKAALHPAAYVVTWISLSGGVIIFNKYLLSTMGFHFRKQVFSIFRSTLKLPSDRLDYMAYALLDSDDPNPRPNYNSPRWPQNGQDDRENLSARDPSHRFLLQLKFDLR